MKILLIEDDNVLAQTLKEELEENYVVDIALSGEEGEYAAFVNEYDIIIVDFNLPGMSGLEVCRIIREGGKTIPVLMLTGEDAVAKKVDALNAGADDYLTKPFHMDELLARIRALLRRPAQALQSNIISIADLEIDLIHQHCLQLELEHCNRNSYCILLQRLPIVLF